MKYRVMMNALAPEKDQGNALSNVQETTVWIIALLTLDYE